MKRHFIVILLYNILVNTCDCIFSNGKWDAGEHLSLITENLNLICLLEDSVSYDVYDTLKRRK